jgi:hypothetical protein
MDAAQQADVLNAALEGKTPEIRQAPNTVVDLMCGVLNKETNSWETKSVVRELTGFDEEALASLDSKNIVYAEYMSALLKRAVVSIGSLTVADRPAIIDELIIGDRDLLFLGIIEATYGKTREYEVACRSCQASNDVIVSLDEFERKQPNQDPQVPMKFTLSNGQAVELRLPNGLDSQVTSKKAKNVAEQNTLILARCLTNTNIKNTAEWAKGLGIKDRSMIIKALLDNQPGPQIGEVNAQCATCGEDLNIVLDWASLLFS